MAFKTKSFLFVLTLFFSLAFLTCESFSEMRMSEGDMGIGFPLGANTEEVNLDLCPIGANVIGMFLESWRKGDFKAMYDLLDDESKKKYPFQQARFDFQMLDYKPYKISSVSEAGENFEFILNHGDWKDGDKSIRKMIISGKSFKIIMPTSDSPFKKSAEDYF